MAEILCDENGARISKGVLLSQISKSGREKEAPKESKLIKLFYVYLIAIFKRTKMMARNLTRKGALY